MGYTLAQGTGLTGRQKKFLAVVLQTPAILTTFYLSGGTALSCWYLHHRESYDIDLFSEKEVNVKYILQWFQKNRRKIEFVSLSHEEQFGFHFFTMKYPEGDILKIDFSYFPSERIEKGLNWKGLAIDSMYDIAVNKLNTVATSPRGRDYVDLFLILQEVDFSWSIDRLRTDAAIKHGVSIERFELAKQFLRVVEFVDFPKMLVSLDRKKMDEFFTNEAHRMKKMIFK